jgi:predicted nucleotidyltransferase
MPDKYMALIREIVLENINREKTTVFLFGSRASSTNRTFSDVDIGFISEGKLSTRLLRKINDNIEESRVPYHVDLVDFYDVDEEFKEKALRDIEIWNRGKFY